MITLRPRDAVERDAEVKFLVDRQPFLDQKRLNDAAFGPGLMRYERHPEDLRSELLSLSRRFGKLHAAALSAASGVDLCLNDDHVGAEFFCRCLSLFRRVSDDAARHRHTIFLEDVLALIFVNFHIFAKY